MTDIGIVDNYDHLPLRLQLEAASGPLAVSFLQSTLISTQNPTHVILGVAGGFSAD